jgi:hypothetical protein
MNLRDAATLNKPTLSSLLRQSSGNRSPEQFALQMCILGAHFMYDACGRAHTTHVSTIKFSYWTDSDHMRFGWSCARMDHRFYKVLRHARRVHSPPSPNIRHHGLLRKLWSFSQKTLTEILFQNGKKMDIYPRLPVFDNYFVHWQTPGLVLVDNMYYYKVRDLGAYEPIALPNYLDQPEPLPPFSPPPPAPLPRQGMVFYILQGLFGEAAGDT